MDKWMVGMITEHVLRAPEELGLDVPHANEGA
jgi:hypothetical protein